MTHYVINPMYKINIYFNRLPLKFLITVLTGSFVSCPSFSATSSSKTSAPSFREGRSAPSKQSFSEAQVKLNQLESAYVLSHIQDPEKPTLILLPGIFRGFLKDEEVLAQLSRKGLNWVAFHTSRHPESLLSGYPNPWIRVVTSQSLARELLILKRALKIQKPILVSLSYSASLIPSVDAQEFPVAIETAPMGQALENNPPSPFYENWRNWMSFFPWGNSVVQSQEYWAYRGYWLQQAANLSKTHVRYVAFQQVIAEGLAQLAWAARDFDLRKQDFKKGPRRFWVLGQNENPERRQIQNEAISIYEAQTGHKKSSFVLRNAGHIIPNEQPEAYAQLLFQLVQASAPSLK